MNQPLTHEKWEELKELYGNNAHQLIESGQLTMNTHYQNAVSNEHVEKWLRAGSRMVTRVKQSASLPFDLERARDNCEVEAINPRSKKWEIVRFLHGGTSIEIEYLDYNQIVFVTANDLRMKYPPKAKP